MFVEYPVFEYSVTPLVNVKPTAGGGQGALWPKLVWQLAQLAGLAHEFSASWLLQKFAIQGQIMAT